MNTRFDVWTKGNSRPLEIKKGAEVRNVISEPEICPRCSAACALVEISCPHVSDPNKGGEAGCCMIHLAWACFGCDAVYVKPRPFSVVSK